jgi:hypothetical protein
MVLEGLARQGFQSVGLTVQSLNICSINNLFIGMKVIKSARGTHSYTVTHLSEQGYLPFPGIGVYFSKKGIET